MLVRVYTCQNTTLLEISCTGSYIITGKQSNKIKKSMTCHIYLIDVHVP